MSLTPKEIQINLIKLDDIITHVCQQAARLRQDVKLIAVSKGHDFSAIKAAYEAGQRDFGESYAKEMSEKMDLAHKLGIKDIIWHFMGAIQTNKLKAIAKA